MKGYVLSVERTIPASPEAIFDVLSDPSKHSLIDGSGMLQGTSGQDQDHQRLALGATFGMGMKMVMRYSTVNRVVEFEDDRLHRVADGADRHLGAGTGRTDLAIPTRARRRWHPGGGELGHHTGPSTVPVEAGGYLLGQDPS